MNCIVSLEKRVESERNEDKDNSKRGRHFERKAVWEQSKVMLWMVLTNYGKINRECVRE